MLGLPVSHPGVLRALLQDTMSTIASILNADGWRQRAAVPPAVLATWAGPSGSRPHGSRQHHQLAACSHGQVRAGDTLAPITDKAACAQGLTDVRHGQGCVGNQES